MRQRHYDAALKFSKRVVKEITNKTPRIRRLLPGRPGDVNSCPIAQTVKHYLPSRCSVTVDDSIKVLNRNGRLRYTADLPALVSNFIEEFDCQGESFSIDNNSDLVNPTRLLANRD